MSTPSTAIPAHHESAVRHIDGRAQYIDDLPEVAGTLHAAPILSPLAHGRVRGMDGAAALAAPLAAQAHRAWMAPTCCCS